MKHPLHVQNCDITVQGMRESKWSNDRKVVGGL